MKTATPHSPPTAAQLDALARFAEIIEDLCAVLVARLERGTFLGMFLGMVSGGMSRKMLTRICEDMRGISDRMRAANGAAINGAAINGAAINDAAMSENGADATRPPPAPGRDGGQRDALDRDALDRDALDRDALDCDALDCEKMEHGDAPANVTGDFGKARPSGATVRAKCDIRCNAPGELLGDVPDDMPDDMRDDVRGDMPRPNSPSALPSSTETPTLDATDAPMPTPAPKHVWWKPATRLGGLPERGGGRQGERCFFEALGSAGSARPNCYDIITNSPSPGFAGFRAIAHACDAAHRQAAQSVLA